MNEKLIALKDQVQRTIPIVENMTHDIAVTPYEPVARTTIPENLPTDDTFASLYSSSTSHIESRYEASVIPARKQTQEVQIHRPQAQIALPSKKEDVVDSLEMKARELQTLVSADGLEIIAQASNNNKHNAHIILHHLVELYKGTEHEVEGDWMVLNGEKISKILFSTYITMTPVFIQWLVEGDDRKTLAFIRMLQMQGQSVGNFVTNIALELDKAYRYRMENEGDADVQVLDLTQEWPDHELEFVIHTLVNAVDQTYKTVYSSVKIALIRILDMSKAKIIV